MAGFDDFTRPIKTLPSCLRRGGGMTNKDGNLYRGANGVYLFSYSNTRPPHLKGFADEKELIDFINANLPWNGSSMRGF